MFIATPEGEILGHYNAEAFTAHLQEMLDENSFRATEDSVWVNHEDVNPVTGDDGGLDARQHGPGHGASPGGSARPSLGRCIDGVV